MILIDYVLDYMLDYILDYMIIDLMSIPLQIAAPLTSMLRKSLTLVIQLLINMANDKFDRNNYGENEARILSASSASKDLTRAIYLTSNTKEVE